MSGAHAPYLSGPELDRATVLSVQGLRRSVGPRGEQTVLLDGVDLDLYDAEVLAVLGPPGSGKTALLNAVAGIERPDSGRVRVAGAPLPDAQVIGHIPVEPVFGSRQSVRDLLAAGVRARGVGRRDVEHEVSVLFERMRLPVDLDSRANELPLQLRLLVAICAQIACGATIFVIDEPYAAIDPPLRPMIETQIGYLRNEFGLSLVIATRSYEQALGMGHRVAVLIAGRVVQIGSPGEVYERPANAEVAALVGAVNLLAPEVSVQLLNQTATFSVRPEKISIVPDGYPEEADEVVATGVVDRVVYLGATSRVTVRLDAGSAEILVLRLNNPALQDIPVVAQQRVTVAWARRHAVRFA